MTALWRSLGAVALASGLCALGALPAAALEIRTDARVDLMGLLQLLAGDGQAERSRYLDEALKRFGPFKTHAAVRRLKDMSNSGFKWDIPSNYAVYLSVPPDMREMHPPPDFFTQHAGGRDHLSAFLADANAFVRDSGFVEWHASQGEDSARLVNALRLTLGGVDLAGPLMRYLGVRTWDRWIVVPSAFFRRDARSAWVLEEKPGLPDIFVVIGPSWDKGAPSFGDLARVANGIWAEPIYSTLYMMVEFCRPLIRPVKNLCEPAWQITDREFCLEKRWVDAIRLRLGEQVFGEKVPAILPRSKIDRAVYSALIEYERRRDQCPDVIACAGMLLAPLQSDGLNPGCRIIDEGRYQEALYERRLGWYLSNRPELCREPALRGVRGCLRAP